VYTQVTINYAVLGNLCPHIHCHLVPQFDSDDPHKPLDTQDHDVRLSESEYAHIIGQIRAALDREE
jgi:diadenosine tetraphosphate (Ap4A) HIT family hydrolase